MAPFNLIFSIQVTCTWSKRKILFQPNLFIIVHNCSVYNDFLSARHDYVHVSVNHTICKASVTYFSECAVNVLRKAFKLVLRSLSVRTVFVPPVNVVKVTTTPTYQYTNPASKHAIVLQAVFNTSNTSPTPVVVTSHPSLPLHIYDVPLPPNLLCHVRKVFPPIPVSADLAIT